MRARWENSRQITVGITVGVERCSTTPARSPLVSVAPSATCSGRFWK